MVPDTIVSGVERSDNTKINSIELQMTKVLPTLENYQDQKRILLAVDCIIFGFDREELKILLIKRDFEPERGKWSLMGGFMHEQETLEQAAYRVLETLTGVSDLYLEQLPAFSQLGRDPVERTVSVPFYSLINTENHDRGLENKYSAKWFSITDFPTLIFDHNEMIRMAIEHLRHNTSVQPVGFELLPEKFTMRDLQKLYEAILGEDLDKRNFIKKIHQMDLLIKLDEKDKASSKKGSYLFKFDKVKYDRMVQRGFIFKV